MASLSGEGLFDSQIETSHTLLSLSLSLSHIIMIFLHTHMNTEHTDIETINFIDKTQKYRIFCFCMIIMFGIKELSVVSIWEK